MASVSIRNFGFVFLLALPVVLAACAEEGDWRAHQRIVVERRPVSLALTIEDETIVKPEDMTRLQSFVDVFLNRGEAPLTVFVSASDGEEGFVAAKRRAQSLVDLLTAMGVEQSSLRVVTPNAVADSKEGAARLGYDVYAVRVPQCGDWSDNSSFTPLKNDPSPSFGCAVSRNIGLMVDNPRDLVRPRELEGRDATRGATIIGKYRAGEDTVSKGKVTTSISSTGTQDN